jgi:hypothetical protein
VFWLKLDESAGTGAADSAGANNGTLSGGSTWRPTGGLRAGAIEFDGSSGQIVVPDADNLDNTAAFTLAYWFNANAYPGDSAGLVCKRNNVNDNNAYTTYLKAADRHIYVDVDGSGNRFSSAALINTGQWYHVAITFDGALPSAGRVKLWINGQSDVTAAETSAAIPNYTSSVRLGNTHPGAVNWFNGRLDDVRFYRRPLSGAEIGALALTNQAPSVFTGTAPTATNGLPADLSGSATDDGKGGALSTAWSLVSGPGSASFANSNSPATTVTFNKSGSHTLRLSASDTQVEVAQDLNVSVSPNTNVFEDWVVFAFAGQTNSAIVGSGADPDGDRVDNLGEFALGLNPSIGDAVAFSPTQPGLPKGAIVDFSGTNHFALLVKRPIGRLGVSYAAEVSGNLAAWTSAGQTGAPVNNGDGTETVTYRDAVPIANAPERFMRLRIIVP